MAIQFNDQTAKEAIASGKVVVIDFWATWCGPCIKLGPVVEELAEKYADRGVVVGKLNIDEDSEIVAENRVRNIPTVLFFKDGEVKARSVGLVKLSDLESHLLPLLG
jgi:thioredoxin 1